MRLSIIIPVYNVEAWIARCLDSCLNQSLSASDYEIILVDDGTKDNSINIAEKYLVHNGNIRIVHQSNQGLSAARNTGLANATGNYVWFIDSDDFIEPDSIKPLLEQAETNGLDVLCFGINLYYEDGRKEYYKIAHTDGIMDGASFIANVAMPPAAWCALYRRGFLLDNSLKFMPGILHEDLEFTPRAYYLAKRISYNPQPVYYYAQREGSIMKSSKNNSKKATDLLKICDSLYSFKKKHINPGTNADDIFNYKIAFAFSQSLRNYSKEAFQIKEYKKRPYYPLIYSNNISKNEKLKYMLINFSLPLYLFLLRITKNK